MHRIAKRPFQLLALIIAAAAALRLLLVESAQMNHISFGPPNGTRTTERGNRRRRPERSTQPGARFAGLPMPACHHHRSANPGRCTAGRCKSVRFDDLAAHVIKAVVERSGIPRKRSTTSIWAPTRPAKTTATWPAWPPCPACPRPFRARR